MTAVVGVRAQLAAAAPPPLVFQAEVGTCFLSSQDTDPATGIAYFIVEDNGTHTCQLVLTVLATGVTAVDVTITNTQAVIYAAAAATYGYNFSDLTIGSLAGSSIPVTGSPALPSLPPPPLSTTGAGCTRALVNRSILGHLATHNTGWNVVSNVSATNCTNQVNSGHGNPSTYSGTVATDLVQVAIPDPFGIKLDKSANVTGAVQGQTVTYSYLVTNTGFVPWASVTIQDGHTGLSAITCPPGTLAPGTSKTCTATYAVTQRSGTVTNTATASGVDTARANPTGSTITSNPSTASFDVVSPASTTTTPASTPPATTTTLPASGEANAQTPIAVPAGGGRQQSDTGPVFEAVGGVLIALAVGARVWSRRRSQ